ncbi:putative reverse transcriptase domain-containing protein [Tanacetum coccineum]
MLFHFKLHHINARYSNYTLVKLLTQQILWTNLIPCLQDETRATQERILDTNYCASVSYKPRTDTSLNRPNPVLAIKGNHDQGNNGNHARDSAFDIGTAEAHFISTDFFPLINSKPSVVNPGYEIEIASGLKVVTNMIVRGSRFELEGHIFIIDLIPFGHGSFDMIVGMDWLSRLGAKIVFFEKIVQIPLSNGEILEVYGERPEGNLKHPRLLY